MSEPIERQHRAILKRIARRAMIERGLLPDFSPEALNELQRIQSGATTDDRQTRDLRNLLWCSIDNDDSRDLDQLTIAQEIPGGVRILVAVSDVDAIVRKGSAIDDHAQHNTTSVYTAGEIFPMLPEKLSTDLTSLSYDEDRLAIVVEMIIGENGSLQNSDIYKATVHNQAKLAYNSVAAWLENRGSVPQGLSQVEGLDENLRLQDQAAQKMKTFRHLHGALSLETVEARPVFVAEQVMDIEAEKKNRAKDIIEDFMIAANGVVARYLTSRNFPTLRRVVHIPKRWDRIVEIASGSGFSLPHEPDARALEEFLIKERTSDPLRFPDLSLSIIKLMGSGEYMADFPGDPVVGHFGLAVKDYTHSTAPNRRYPDLITQRLLKAVMAGQPISYNKGELETLAKHCTLEEDAVHKVERLVEKSAAAIFLESRIGQEFDAIVTGAAPKGTWVRLFHPPIEGKLIHGFEGLDVGHRVRVKLIHTDVQRGFIDFKRVD